MAVLAPPHRLTKDGTVARGNGEKIESAVKPANAMTRALGIGVGEQTWTGCRHLETVGDGARRWETAGHGGTRRDTAGHGGSLLLRVYRTSTDEQETLGAIGSYKKSTEVTVVYSPTTDPRAQVRTQPASPLGTVGSAVRRGRDGARGGALHQPGHATGLWLGSLLLRLPITSSYFLLLLVSPARL